LSAKADLILLEANVITLDGARPRAGAVAVGGSRILAVGGGDDLAPVRGPKTQVIDCRGRTVLPGFNDAHCHPLALAAGLISVDCGPSAVRSIADIEARIAQQAARVPPGTWIRAGGYNEFYLTEKRHPDRRDLDRAAPDHPVKLTHRTGHACVLNSLALGLLGITEETPEPEGGLIDRDLEGGLLSGLLFEMNDYVDRLVPPLSDEDLAAGVRLANGEFLSHGITSVQDASWSGSPRRWQTLQRFKEGRALLPRVSMMVGADELAEFEESVGRGGDRSSAALHPGAVKIVVQSTTGCLCPAQEELNELVYRLHSAGHQVAIHADERDSVEAAVIALEQALSRKPGAGHRHRIEHCSVCPPALIQRLKHVGALVVTQPAFIYYSGQRYLATVAAEDLEWLYPLGSLCATGLTVAGSSDAPVVPLDPLAGICAAVTRTAESGEPLLPREGLSIEEALRLYTLNGALASFEEDVKGSITAGRLADLVILDEDPTAVAPESIRDIEVDMTIIDGEIVWQREKEL
jgi:predicted amidohydrolase YtcJ